MPYWDYDIYTEDPDRRRRAALEFQADLEPETDPLDKLAAHLEAVPERPQEGPGFGRRLKGILIGAAQGAAGYDPRTIERTTARIRYPEYTRELEDWRQEGDVLDRIAGLSLKQAEEGRRTAEHESTKALREAQMAREKAGTEYYKTQQARLGQPSPPKDLEEHLARVLHEAYRSGDMPVDEYLETVRTIREIIATPKTKSSYEQKFDQRVREYLKSGEASTPEQAETMAAQAAIAEAQADLANVRARTRGTEQLAEFRGRMKSGDITPQEARQLLSSIHSEVRARMQNYDPDLSALGFGEAVEYVARERGIDLETLRQKMAQDAALEDRIEVRSPDGQVGTIPRSQWPEAKTLGYTLEP